MKGVKIRRWQAYMATVKIRRGEGWDVRPGAEAMDGSRIPVTTGWRMDATDSSIYVGEWAMLVEGPLGPDQPHWISGTYIRA